MLTTGSNPHALIRKLQHFRSVISGLICSVFDMHDLRGKPGKVLVFSFILGPEPQGEADDHEAPRSRLEIVLWAPGNYVGVFYREVKDAWHFSFDEGGGNCWLNNSYHDSCWRTDGIWSLMQEFGDRIEACDIFHACRVRDVNEEIQGRFRTIIDQRRGY